MFFTIIWRMRHDWCNLLDVVSSLRETGRSSLAGFRPVSLLVSGGFSLPLTDAPSLWRVFIITKYLINDKIFFTMKIDPSELVSIREAAKMRGVSAAAIQQLMQRGRLTVIEISGKKFLLRKEIEGFEPLPVGRPRKDSAAAKSSQGSKAAKRSRTSATKSAKKKRSS